MIAKFRLTKPVIGLPPCYILLSLQTELLNAVLSGDALQADSILRSARVGVDERLKVSICTLVFIYTVDIYIYNYILP